MVRCFLKLVGVFGMGLCLACSPLAKKPVSPQKANFLAHAVHECPLKFEKLGLCAQLAGLRPSYPVGRPLDFKIAFWQSETAHFLGPYAALSWVPQAWLWMRMTTGSHGAPEITMRQSREATEAEGSLGERDRVIPGVYDLNRVVFTMEPDHALDYWEIHVELHHSDGTLADEASQVIWSYLGV